GDLTDLHLKVGAHELIDFHYHSLARHGTESIGARRDRILANLHELEEVQARLIRRAGVSFVSAVFDGSDGGTGNRRAMSIGDSTDQRGDRSLLREGANTEDERQE